MYAINTENGVLKWKWYTRWPVSSQISVNDNGLFISSKDEQGIWNVYALNTNDGKIIWKSSIDSEANLQLIRDKLDTVLPSLSLLYASTKNGYLYAVDTANGEIKSKYYLNKTIVSLFSGETNEIYALTSNATLYRFFGDSLDFHSKTDLSMYIGVGSEVYSALYLRGFIYIASSRALHGVDPTGTERYKNYYFCKSLAAAGKMLFAVCGGGDELIAIDTVSGDSKGKWVGTDDIFVSTAKEKSGKEVVIASTGNKLYKFDQEVRIIDDFNISNGKLVSQPIIAKNKVFVGSTDGYIYAVAPTVKTYEKIFFPIYEQKGIKPIGTDGSYEVVDLKGKRYVVVGEKEISELLFVQNSNDVTTLKKGDKWDLGGGHWIKVKEIDITAYPTQAWLTLYNGSEKVDDKVVYKGVEIVDGRGGSDFWSVHDKFHKDFPIFLTYIESISKDSVDLIYTWLRAENPIPPNEYENLMLSALKQVTEVEQNATMEGEPSFFIRIWDSTNLGFIGLISAVVVIMGIFLFVRRRKALESKSISPQEFGPSPLTPKTFPTELQPKYTDIEFLGKGGFARVFKAKRNSDGKVVAVKIPISLDEATGRSFLKEIKAWEEMKHPNIVELYDMNIMPLPYFEMEYVDNRSIEELKKPVEIEKAVRIAFDIAEGLKYAHTIGIIHRDLKPHNVLLTSDLRSKITDWGLSKVLAESKTSSIAGFSPVYAAPEQVSPKQFGNADSRTDIYQLGTIFYELVAGRLPFGGDSLAEISAAIINEKPVLPSLLNPEVKDVENIILKCLSKKKEERYQSAEKLQTALAEYLKREYKKSLKESAEKRDITKSRLYCGDLVLISAKLGDYAEVLKYLSVLIDYAKPEEKTDIENLMNELNFRLKEGISPGEDFADKIKILAYRVQMK